MANNPNPFRDPGPWGVLSIGGWIVPARLISVDGIERPHEWAVQKGTGTSGATTVWRGIKVCEGSKTLFEATDETTFDAFYEFRDRIEPPKGKKPPTFAVINPFFNFCRVDRISLKTMGSPKVTPTLSYQLEVQWIEYRPSQPAKVGPQDPALPPATPSPLDAAEKQFADLIAKAATLGGNSGGAQIGSNNNKVGGL